MKHPFKNAFAVILGFGLIAITASWAAGTTADVAWVAPTTYTDGSPLPTSDIASYIITWTPATGQSGPSGSTNVPAGALTATVPVPCGSTSFTIAITTNATAKFPNITSAPTSPVPYATGVTCAPNPPSGLAVH